ncbi:unnamed protein product [Nippostrongylus brasiliensis]|uniref:Multiple coagulation factor deficiency protein 2 (inferred by orthology to a human protein) n=1 Tax=Nippostrongylus brasiliensis TaxID=27835 RepID=A0A0N4XDC5_NIPBR|nr:unnamed protein product [Nippostrongylus brasiliensis]
MLVVPSRSYTQFAGLTEILNAEHIKQHLEDKIDASTMSERKRRFHYFSMNDLNKDNRIDGTEILKAVKEGWKFLRDRVLTALLYFIPIEEQLSRLTAVTVRKWQLFLSSGLMNPYSVTGGAVQSDETYATTVDEALREMDVNGDGYIDFSEYMGKQKN